MMQISLAIANKYKDISHREAFIVAKKEYHLDDKKAMIVADEVYQILNPIPITKMKDWKKEIWERPDFKKLKKLVNSYEEAKSYYCETNHQMIMVHLKINEEKSYRDVMDMINKFKNFKVEVWGDYVYPITLDNAEKKLREYFEDIDKEIDKFFLFSNGNSEYLVSTYKIKNVEPCLL